MPINRTPFLILLVCFTLLLGTGCRRANETAEFRDHDRAELNDQINDPYPITAKDLAGVPYDEQEAPRATLTTNDDSYTLPKKDVDAALASTTDNKVDVGDTAVVPVWSWVEVQNPDGVKSGNNEFPFGDTCGVDTGHVMTTKALDGDKVLVEYDLPYQAYGTPCPDGTLFFTSREAFLRSTDQYITVRSDDQNGKARVEQLLADAEAK